MKLFDYYYNTTIKGNFYYVDNSYVVQVTSDGISYDDIAEEVDYKVFSDYTSDIRTTTLNTRRITHSFKEASIEAIQQNYPELFI